LNTFKISKALSITFMPEYIILQCETKFYNIKFIDKPYIFW